MEMNQQLPYSWDLLPYVQYHVSHEQHTVAARHFVVFEEETKNHEVVVVDKGPNNY